MAHEFISDRTPRQALRDLLDAPRLRFGDPFQIEALFILRCAEELLEIPRECPECDGTGETEDDEPGECDKCGRTCSHCSYSTSDECEECEGSGEVPWTRDDVYDRRASIILTLLTERRKAA